MNSPRTTVLVTSSEPLQEYAKVTRDCASPQLILVRVPPQPVRPPHLQPLPRSQRPRRRPTRRRCRRLRRAQFNLD